MTNEEYEQAKILQTVFFYAGMSIGFGIGLMLPLLLGVVK